MLISMNENWTSIPNNGWKASLSSVSLRFEHIDLRATDEIGLCLTTSLLLFYKP